MASAPMPPTTPPTIAPTGTEGSGGESRSNGDAGSKLSVSKVGSESASDSWEGGSEERDQLEPKTGPHSRCILREVEHEGNSDLSK